MELQCSATSGFRTCSMAEANKMRMNSSSCRKPSSSTRFVQLKAFKVMLNAGIAAAVLFNCNAPPVSLAFESASVEEELLPIPNQFPPLPDLSAPPYEKMVLNNGLRVFLLEDHELGLVGGELIVRGGTNQEPEDKVGLARMTSAVQRSGGTSSHPGDRLDVELESMAARIEASASAGSLNVGFRCLGDDVKSIFPIFSEVVRFPAMPQEKLELVRRQLRGTIARREDNPESVASIQFRKLLYGDTSIYARVPENNTVQNVTRDDLITFHEHLFRPERAVFGVWGDFDSNEMKSMIEREFSAWKPSADSQNVFQANEVETGISAAEPNIYVIDRPGMTQGYVRMGELGTTIADPDVFALDVLNGVLNSFGGLLFDEIRSKEGLAYSVSGGWSPSIEHRGAFIAGGETQIQSVPRFLAAMKTVLKSVTEKPVTEEQLAQAKEAALNSFVFNFASRESQLARVLVYDLFGIDQNLPFTYKKRVEALTREDVLQAAKRHLHPELEPVLVVTDARQLPAVEFLN